MLYTAAKIQVYTVSPADLNNGWFLSMAHIGSFFEFINNHMIIILFLHHLLFRDLTRLMKQVNLNIFCMTASLAKCLNVCLWTKWLWVQFQLQLLIFCILYFYTRICLSICCNLFSCLVSWSYWLYLFLLCLMLTSIQLYQKKPINI